MEFKKKSKQKSNKIQTKIQTKFKQNSNKNFFFHGILKTFLRVKSVAAQSRALQLSLEFVITFS
jgi:hypothetical protein